MGYGSVKAGEGSWPSWMGYSVGRWDGDTLVVDSAGFNDKTWVSRYGVSHNVGAVTDGGGLACSVQASRLRPPAGGGHLHRSRCVREAVGLCGDHGARGRYGHAQPFRGPRAGRPRAPATLRLGRGRARGLALRSSEDWTGSLSDAADRAVSVPPSVLARYVGVYTGTYAAASWRPTAKLDGLLGGALGRRHAGRRQCRVQRQDVGESLRGLAHGGAADHGALPASRLRPPAGGGHLHRSRCVREAVGLYHGARGRRTCARPSRTEQRRLDGQPLGRRQSASVPRASTRVRRGRSCHNRRRCSKASVSVTGSSSTTRGWRQTSW